MRFRLVIHDTKEDNKYEADRRYEFFGDKEAIWFLWYTFVKREGKRHVEVFDLAGDKQRPEVGIHGMSDYNV